MTLDTFIRKGNHPVCEDAILAFNKHANFQGIVLSDGCSSSNNSHIGSSLLTLEVNRFVHVWNYSDTRGIPSSELNQSMIYRIKHLMRDYFLDSNVFDATLGLAYKFHTYYNVVLFGDGIVGVKLKNKSWEYHVVDYDQNAPFYISYGVNEERLIQYQSQFQNQVKSIDIYDGKDHRFTASSDLFEPVNFRFPIEEVEMIMISSDGLKSFRNKIGEVLAIETVLNEVTAFKNLNGQFVQRRMNGFLRNFPDYTNEDDVSIGVLCE